MAVPQPQTTGDTLRRAAATANHSTNKLQTCDVEAQYCIF